MGLETRLTLLFVPTGYAIPMPKELDGATNFAFSPDTNIVAAVVHGCVKLWDLRTNQVDQLDPSCRKGVYRDLAIAFSPNGILAVGYDSGIIRLWNLENHTELPPLELPLPFQGIRRLSVSKVAFSPAGKYLAVVLEKAYGGKGAIVWDVEKRNIIKYFGVLADTWNLNFASRASILAMQTGYKTIQVWSVKEDLPPVPLNMSWALWSLLWPSFVLHDAVINDIAISPDGTIVATGHRDGKIKLWNTQNSDLLTTIDAGEERFDMTFSPNGKTLAIVSHQTDGIIFHDIKLFYAEK